MDKKSATIQTDTAVEGSQSVIDLLRAPAAAPLAPIPLEVLVPEAKQQTPAVGQRVTRPDCRLHGLGQTKYIDDFYLPGMLYAKIKRAGIASARIVSIDTTEAEAMPGVVAVLTGRDVPCNSFGPSLKDQPVLADTRVFHAGDGVAAVAAVTEQIATEALEKIKVEYEPLHAGARSAGVAEVSKLQASTRRTRTSTGTRSSRRATSRRVSPSPTASSRAPSGPRWSSTCRSSPIRRCRPGMRNGRVTIYSTLGRITLGRADLARTLGIPMSRIRVIATVVGGNFGGKNEITHGAGAGAPRQEDGPAGEVHVHAAGGVHLVHHASPAHHGLQDGRDEGGQDPGAADPARARRRRLLLVERDDARQGLHSRRPVPTRSRTSRRRRSSSTRTRR